MAEQNNVDLLPGGMRFFNPTETAPDFVVGTLVVSLNDFFAYCKAHPELQTEHEGKKQLKIQLLISKASKLYGKVDDYKKEDQPQGKRPPVPGKAKAAEPAKATEEEPEDDLPF